MTLTSAGNARRKTPPAPRHVPAAPALRILAVALGCLAAFEVFAATRAEKPEKAEDAPQLFLDHHLIERMTTATLHLHSPIPHEVVFRFDAPWEGPDCGYVTVLKDGDRFRMYYRGGGELTEEVTCLAESDDAIHWTRPTLGLFDFKGSKDNNIIWKGREKSYWESHNLTPFIDTNPAARLDERYKAVALARYPVEDKANRKIVLVSLISPDGIHWKRQRDEPILRKGGFDSQNLAFWDTARGEYACYARIGREGKRSVERAVSKDFITWTEPELLDFGPTPLEQFYTNAILPYFRNPHIYVGFPMRFVPERKSIGDPPRQTDGLSDAVFISSRDGLHFDRTFLEALIRPGLDPLNWGHAHGNSTPAWGLLPMNDKEISIYWTEQFGTSAPLLRRGTFRTDGFISVHAPYYSGELITKPVIFQGKELVINYSTSAVGSVAVEVQDADGNPVPGFELDRAIPIYGDEIERRVAWKGNPDLGALAGKPVRLRFVISDGDLYSFRVRN